jgi:hypothetical protein
VHRKIHSCHCTLHNRRIYAEVVPAGGFSYGESHTAENLKDELLRVTNEWQIASNVVCVVTDNAANISKAVKLANFRHLGYFIHTLNLIVQKAIPAIKPLKSKVKAIVEYFHRSTIAAEELKSLERQMRPGQQPLKLRNDVVTRWNSTYLMLQCMCDVQELLEAATAALRNPVEPLTSHEWAVLKEVSAILYPFDEVTTELGAEQAMTVSKIILLSCGLMLVCDDVKNSCQ